MKPANKTPIELKPFERSDFSRLISWIHDAFNQPAIACYKKVGFQVEGHLRDYRKVGESYWSSYLMAILESDWRARKNGG